MPDEIQPALTPEEWTRRCVRLEEHLGRETAVAVVESHLLLRSHDTWRGEPYSAAVLATPHTLLSIIALANAALPDDDPRKITHEDVARLRSIEERLADSLDAQGAHMVRVIAAKLAALLPPDVSAS